MIKVIYANEELRHRFKLIAVKNKLKGIELLKRIIHFLESIDSCKEGDKLYLLNKTLVVLPVDDEKNNV